MCKKGAIKITHPHKHRICCWRGKSTLEWFNQTFFLVKVTVSITRAIILFKGAYWFEEGWGWECRRGEHSLKVMGSIRQGSSVFHRFLSSRQCVAERASDRKQNELKLTSLLFLFFLCMIQWRRACFFYDAPSKWKSIIIITAISAQH